MICNNFIPYNGDNSDDREYIMTKASGKGFIVGIFKTKVSNVNDFKQYLNNNPIDVQFYLNTTTTKIVSTSVIDQYN